MKTRAACTAWLRPRRSPLTILQRVVIFYETSIPSFRRTGRRG